LRGYTFWEMGMAGLWWIPIVVVPLLVVVVYLWRPRRRTAVRSVRLTEAKRRFHIQRERLEAKFVQLASADVAPDLPRWTDCSFADDVAYVRDRMTGELSAFVAVTIATEDEEDLFPDVTNAVGNLQAGTAIFRLDRDHWETDGRTILNLSPSEAAHYYRDDIEIVGEELAQHRQ
jgi:hypothetical protein